MLQVNLHGIRYFIDGNLEDPEVQRRMHEARLHLQNLVVANPNVDDYRLEKSGLFKVRSVFGEVTIHIEAPLVGVEERGLIEEETPVLEEEKYRFVPAICIGNPELYPYTTFVAWQEISDISICAGAFWEGILVAVEDSPTAANPGEVYKDGPLTEDRKIEACYNWGNRGFWFDFDDEPETATNTDSLFSPMPYLGFSTDGAVDYMWSELNETQTTNTGVPYPSHEWSETIADYNDCHNSLYWTCKNFWWETSQCLEWIPSGYCCKHWWKDTFIHGRHRCGYGHLMFEYSAEAYKERKQCNNVFRLTGICFYLDCNMDGSVHTSPVGGTQGSAQNREVYDSYDLPYYGYTDDMERSDGELRFGRAEGWDYGATEYEDITAIMTGPCDTSQTDVSSDLEIYPQYYGYPGAYIQDIGEEAYICPVATMHNKYFLMIVEEVWDYYSTGSCDPWEATGYGYDGAGVYDHGSVGTCTGRNEVRADQYQILCVNLNGERIEIDRGDDGSDFFNVTDSLILDFKGTPIYMYAYMRTRYGNGGYQTTYVRYGYFMNENHYQSEIFYPVPVTNAQGHITCLHDVYDSIERSGQYGYGQCAGYIITERETKHGVTTQREELL